MALPLVAAAPYIIGALGGGSLVWFATGTSKTITRLLLTAGTVYVVIKFVEHRYGD